MVLIIHKFIGWKAGTRRNIIGYGMGLSFICIRYGGYYIFVIGVMCGDFGKSTFFYAFCQIFGQLAFRICVVGICVFGTAKK